VGLSDRDYMQDKGPQEPRGPSWLTALIFVIVFGAILVAFIMR
jgi:hypothetical protein